MAWGLFGKSDPRSEARRALKAGDFRTAGDRFRMIGAYDEALQAYTQGSLFVEAAMLCEEIGQWERAGDFWAQARRYREAGGAYLKAGLPNEARQAFEKAQDYGRAKELALRLNQWDRAGEYAEKIRQWGEAAQYYYRAEMFEKAALVAERALEVLEAERKEREYLPEWQREYRTICRIAAQAYTRTQQLHRAAELYEAMGEFKKAREAYLACGNAVKALEMSVRLEDYVTGRSIIERYPEARVALQLCGHVYLHLGEFAEAAKYYMAAGQPLLAAQAFDQMGRYVDAAFLYEQAGEWEQAGELYVRAQAWDRAAAIYAKMGSPLQAAAYYEKAGRWELAVELYAQAQRYTDAGRLLYQLGRTDEAIALLQKVDRQDPTYVQGVALLCRLWIEKGMASLALRRVEELIAAKDLDTDGVELYYLQGRALEALGRFQEALAVYESVVAQDMHYADTQERIQRLTTPSTPTAPDVQTHALDLRWDVLGVLVSAPHMTLLKVVDKQRNSPALVQRIQAPGLVLSDAKARLQGLRGLRHRLLALPYDVTSDGDALLVCVDYAEGVSLREWLRTTRSVAEVQEVTLQIAQALAFCHRSQVVFGALLPEHVLVASDRSVKLVPWDVYLSALPTEMPYASPEYRTRQSLSPASDVYAFGVLLHELLFHRLPTWPLSPLDSPGQPSGASGTGVPSSLVRIVTACLQPDPAQRVASMDGVVEALATIDIYEGALIDDRYEILKELGRGGMARVYLAHDRVLGEKVALKVWHSDLMAMAATSHRLLREVKLARSILHPNVVRLFELGTYRGARYVTMEYVPGASLDAIVRRTGPIPPRLWWKLAVQIVEGLKAAHDVGVIHRDLKPQNIMVTQDGRVKILDFGIAGVLDSSDHTQTQSIIGSPKYMAPEQIQGQRLDVRTDLYALGAIFYFMLTGREAFSAETVQAILTKQLTEMPLPLQHWVPNLPGFLNDWVLKLLAKRMEDRPPNCTAVLEFLYRIKDSL
ncbi:MAG: protein kinase [Acidobacteriota bacterium]|nr:protein kinase [Acidobacteriota bacterium]